MSKPWLPALTAAVLAALDRRRLPETIAIGFLAIVGLTIALVSTFGDADGGEPKQVVKIAKAEAKGEGGPIIDAPPGEPLTGAVSLVGDQALMEPTSFGALPRIAADGRKPMEVYARAFDKRDRRPKIAIVLGGLGVGKAITDAALERLPPAVTLAFTPYGQTLAADVATARARGHEVLLEMPLAPESGPYALAVGAAAKNTLRLKWLMSRVTGYAGLINTDGAAFLASKPDAAFLLGELARRGLFFVEHNADPRSSARNAATSAGGLFVKADGFVGQSPTRDAIDKDCANIEAQAKAHGAAIAVTQALPVTIDRLTAWAKTLDAKGIVLVPASALAAAAPVGVAGPSKPAQIATTGSRPIPQATPQPDEEPRSKPIKPRPTAKARAALKPPTAKRSAASHRHRTSPAQTAGPSSSTSSEPAPPADSVGPHQ